MTRKHGELEGPIQVQDATPSSLAVGVDLVQVDEVAAALADFGDRYLCRVFTEDEVASASNGAGVSAAHLAARFAAKEAAIKVLRPTDHLPTWRSIEVRQGPSGRCSLRLSGHAAELARLARLNEFAVSLSHQGNIAAAVVLALGKSEA